MGMRIGDKWTIASHDEERDTYDLEHDKTHAILTVRKNIIDEALRDSYETKLMPYVCCEWECGDEKYMLDEYNIDDDVVYLCTESGCIRAMSISLFIEKWSPVIIKSHVSII